MFFRLVKNLTAILPDFFCRALVADFSCSAGVGGFWTDQLDCHTLFSVNKETSLGDTTVAQINWVLHCESCLEAPETPTDITERPSTDQQLHEFFQPFSHLHKSNESASYFGHCQQTWSSATTEPQHKINLSLSVSSSRGSQGF